MLTNTRQERTPKPVEGVLNWCTSYSRQNMGNCCYRPTARVESSFLFTSETSGESQLGLQANTLEF